LGRAEPTQTEGRPALSISHDRAHHDDTGGAPPWHSWANAEPDAAQRVRDLEHQADDTKRELRLALTKAFITPIDAEDIYVMSERLNAVLNGAKDTVRESDRRRCHVIATTTFALAWPCSR
jgi:Protein of unknown function DUF47